MKSLIIPGCLAAFIYLQSCGDSMIKNNTPAVSEKPADSTVVATAKASIPNANTNLIIKDSKDLIGYWVGEFVPDTVLQPIYAGEATAWDYVNKINISIDSISGSRVTGHSVVAGNNRPFSGTLVKDGGLFSFAVNEPGDDKYDGKFNFYIGQRDSVLAGTWQANGKIRIPRRRYALTKKIFEYDPKLQITGERFMDWNKNKKVKKGDYDVSYFATTFDVYKYNASTDVITKQQAANLKKADLFILRNAIYARHGYSFKNQQLRAYFDKQPWYIPVSTDVKNEFTAIEKQNIELLLRYEKNAKEYYDVFGRG